MGEQAMTGAVQRAPQLSITDPKVCRSYLVGTCPYDLFTNTKQDFGPCPKQHIEGLKVEYEAASDAQKEQWGFKFDYLRDMETMVNDCNRRTDAAQKRLEKTPDEIRQTNALVSSCQTFTSLAVRFFLRNGEEKLMDHMTPAQANRRPLRHNHARTQRNRDHGRDRRRRSSCSRALQSAHCPSSEAGT